MYKLIIFTTFFVIQTHVLASEQIPETQEFEIKRKAMAAPETQCPVCLEMKSPNNLAYFRSSAQTQCNHSVCKECHQSFVKHSTKCPYCRQSFERLVDAQGATLYTRQAPSQLGRCTLTVVKAGIILIPLTAMVGLQLMSPEPYRGLAAASLGGFAWELIMGHEEQDQVQITESYS